MEERLQGDIVSMEGGNRGLLIHIGSWYNERRMTMSERQLTSEFETVVRDSESSYGRSPEDRMAIFLDLLRLIDAIWMHLPEEERRRRLRVAEEIDALPEPWWTRVPPKGRS